MDVPTLARFEPDWSSGLEEAMRLRPELVIAREDVKRRQLELKVQYNNLLPDVRIEGGYGLHGFGTRLDGESVFSTGSTDNAFRSLADTHFTDYNFGIIGSMPLGFRAQHASAAAAMDRLRQSYLVLRDQEIKARNNLEVAYRQVISSYEIIIARRSQRLAAAEQVEARYKEYLAGKTTVDFLLTAQQQWAAALSQEYQAITNYNFFLAAWEFCKGTLLQHNNIQIGEAGLPGCIQVRAVENERQRAKAIALRERAGVVSGQGQMCPDLPMATSPSLPSLMMDESGKDRIPDRLEDPVPVNNGPATQTAPQTGGLSAPVPPAPLTMPTAPGTIPPPPPAIEDLR